ncbi:MAG: hypothetical protein CL849_04745 [Crocinitomicaceae bacterium]|nr:hypothetical protein [Crocinitomicaceae bacterium]
MKNRPHPCLLRVGMLCILMGQFVVSQGQDKSAHEAEKEEKVPGLADTDPLRSDDLWFLHSVEDDILGQENLSGFLARFRSVLRGTPVSGDSIPVSVFHFGGSHVQAGRIGWAFRKRLAQDRPGLVVSRGILPPHRLAGENGPPEVRWSSSANWQGQRSSHRRHTGDWGITGLEVSAAVPDTVCLWNGEWTGQGCVDAIDILSPTENHWEWSNPHSLPSEEPLEVDAGDTLMLWTTDSVARLHGVWMRNRDAALVYHDLGGNGASTAAWLRHSLLEEQLEHCPADLAILAWGINDAHMRPDRFDPDRFKERYSQLITAFRAAHPAMDILLVTNNDSHYRNRHNPNAERVRQTMAALVEEMEVACWDLYGVLGGAHSMDLLQRTGFASSDHLHFNRNGYELIGELLYDALVRAALQNAMEP